jgi:hypothetical protein
MTKNTEPTQTTTNTELGYELASKAFALLGTTRFEVSAALSVDDAASLRNFGKLQSILLMAYEMGRESAAGQPESIAVNAMALMFGMVQASPSVKALVEALQEAGGGGFIDALNELAPLAVKTAELEDKLHAAAEACHESFLGVFPYEVSEALGRYIERLASSSDACLLNKAQTQLGNLAGDFTARCTEDGAVLPAYADAIAEAIPGWENRRPA